MRGHCVDKGTAALALCAWCGWASGFQRATPGAEITWLITTGSVLAFDLALWRGAKAGSAGVHLQPARDPWPRPDPGGKGPALRGDTPWLGFIVVIVAWEVLGIDTGPHPVPPDDQRVSPGLPATERLPPPGLGPQRHRI